MSESLIEKYPFFFNVSCSCHNHDKYSNILAKTGCFFLIPAFLFLYNSSNILTIINGSLTLMITMTSITYHLTHKPYYKCIDVITVWMSGIIGAYNTIIWLYYYCSIYLIITLSLIIIMFFMDLYGYTYYLKYHLLLHIFGSTALSFLAIHNIIYN